MFHTFGNHPLLVQALASEVANNHGLPGDWDDWRAKRPDFNPFRYKRRLVKLRTHILEHSFRGLPKDAVDVLDVLPALRLATEYQHLHGIFLSQDGTSHLGITDKESPPSRHRNFKTGGELDDALTVLHDRGLIGCHENVYDVHPVVRGVVRASWNEQAKRAIYKRIAGHFARISASVRDQRTALSSRHHTWSYSMPVLA